MLAKIESTVRIDDAAIAAFLGLARSANVYFDLVNDRLTVRAVNPDWLMWTPIRHFLDEIGKDDLEDFMRRHQDDDLTNLPDLPAATPRALRA